MVVAERSACAGVYCMGVSVGGSGAGWTGISEVIRRGFIPGGADPLLAAEAPGGGGFGGGGTGVSMTTSAMISPISSSGSTTSSSGGSWLEWSTSRSTSPDSGLRSNTFGCAGAGSEAGSGGGGGGAAGSSAGSSISLNDGPMATGGAAAAGTGMACIWPVMVRRLGSGALFFAYRSASICWTPRWVGSSSRISLEAAMARGRKPSRANPSAANL